MYHKTYRLSITLAKGEITYPGEPNVVVQVDEGGHDQVLDKALDYLRSVGRSPVSVEQAPRLDFIPSSTIRTERYIVITAPLESATGESAPVASS